MGIKAKPHPLLKDTPLVDLCLYDWAIITDHHLKEVHLVINHHLSTNPSHEDEIRTRWFHKSSDRKPFVLQTPFVPLINQIDYQHAFQAIHRDLTKGRAYQVNYTQPFLASYQGDSWGMYAQIKRKNPVPFSAFLRTNSADILSFSPERFLTIDKGHVFTSPIKGTAKRSENPIEDEQLRMALQSCTKNRAENIMIVDLLRNDLGRFAKTGSVQVTALCEPQSYHSVHHLVSDIRAQCTDNTTPLQAFLACFPGGSITGAPKQEAMRIINEHERYARGVYCGSIAYFSTHGRMDSSIAIRTITATKNQLYLAAGGGIVIDSQCEDEYQECFTKIAALV